MQKVLTAAQMHEVDRLTTERYGIPSIILMENAAHAVARVITEKLGGSVKGKSILILCGKGNNGGDGAALARILWTFGASVDVQLFGRMADTKGDARSNFEILSKLSYQVSDPAVWFEEFDAEDHLEPVNFWTHKKAAEIDVVVDALFGTGLNRAVESGLRALIIATSQMVLEPYDERDAHPLFVSIDLPSGLVADSSCLPIFARFEGDKTAVGIAANVTVTFSALKPANILPPASNLSGEVVVASIGSPQELIDEQQSQVYRAERSDVAQWVEQTKFSSSSYKNRRGHVLLIAGSENYSGAAVLAGNAAMRSGVGLVTIGVPRSSKDAIADRLIPEIMVRPLEETDSGAVSEDAIAEVEDFLKIVDAIAIGSGLSANDESTQKLVRHFVKNRRMPTILDADALTMLSPMQKPARVSSPHVSKGSRSEEMSSEGDGDPPLIMTPHEGEFLRLLGTDDKDAIKDRVTAVREFSQKHGVILVLKGERVLIGEPSGKVVVNPTGNSGLGKAGNGDTLTGILVGFVAQAVKMNIDIFETVVAAVYIAGMAGDIAEKKYGKRVMTASDVRECLVEAFSELITNC